MSRARPRTSEAGAYIDLPVLHSADAWRDKKVRSLNSRAKSREIFNENLERKRKAAGELACPLPEVVRVPAEVDHDNEAARRAVEPKHELLWRGLMHSLREDVPLRSFRAWWELAREWDYLPTDLFAREPAAPAPSGRYGGHTRAWK